MQQFKGCDLSLCYATRQVNKQSGRHRMENDSRLQNTSKVLWSASLREERQRIRGQWSRWGKDTGQREPKVRMKNGNGASEDGRRRGGSQGEQERARAVRVDDRTLQCEILTKQVRKHLYSSQEAAPIIKTTTTVKSTGDHSALNCGLCKAISSRSSFLWTYVVTRGFSRSRHPPAICGRLGSAWALNISFTAPGKHSRAATTAKDNTVLSFQLYVCIVLHNLLV